MPPNPEKRNDGRHVGPTIREMVRLMLEEGLSRNHAADAVGFNRKRAKRALDKPHVIAFRKHEKAKLTEELSAAVPRRLHELMMKDDNQNAAVRAATALHDIASAELTSRRPAFGSIVQTPGLTIQVITEAPKPLPAPPMTTIEHAPQLIEQKAADEE